MQQGLFLPYPKYISYIVNRVKQKYNPQGIWSYQIDFLIDKHTVVCIGVALFTFIFNKTLNIKSALFIFTFLFFNIVGHFKILNDI